MKQFKAIRSINSENGVALILALLAMLMLSLFGLTLLGIGMTEVTIETNWKDYSEAFYAAEAGLASGLVDLRALLATNPTPTPSELAFAPPSLSNPELSFDTFQVQQVGPYQGNYQGLLAVTTDYTITAQVSGAGGTSASLTQVVHYMEVPLFQYGVLYGRGVDLEIAPGPAMTFNGRVHSNSDIYVAAGSSLSFDSFMSTAGNVYRRLKRSTAIPYGNNPQIMDDGGTYQTLNFDHEYQPGFGSTWSESEWKSAAQSTFGGKVQDSAMGVEEIVPQIPELFYDPANPDVVAHQLIEMPKGPDPPELLEAKLYSKADLRIIDGIATDAVGNPVALPPGALTTKTFYDKREERTMTVTEVDVGLVATSFSGGVLYVARTGAAAGGEGVRLVNGATLPGAGLTVVSENPVYVQGDYNTVNQVAAAVLADAITVLSNNWGPNDSDNKGSQATSNRPATSTTVNAAFALGPSAESQLNQGNGQLENVIRFLENWSGDTLNYEGSIIALWHSLQATGDWRCCGDSGNNYYRPPIRNWSYDTSFNTTQPPGSPVGIVVAKGRWSRS
ncbi:MAG: PilX N-terminal domain-containing pilus assembly protein [Anaerolineae bacterium]